MGPPPEGTATEWDAEAYDDHHSFVVEFGEDLIGLLDPRAGERILDLGCGTGHLTDALRERGADVVGLDSSEDMVTRAREAYPECRFVCADAGTFGAAEPFDAVFSNAALHWIADQRAVAERVRDALRPGGRFVAEMGAAGNIVEILDGVADVADREGIEVTHPWHFPTLGAYSARLEEQGFTVCLARTFERPTTLEGSEGLREWFHQFGDALLAPFPDEDSAMTQIEDELRDECYDANEESWTVTYHRLQFRAILER